MALAKKNRLAGQANFDRVFREGETVKNSFFFIKRLSNQAGNWRAGIGISAKAVKPAVRRHRLKRIITEVLREHEKNIPPVDLVIVFSQPILKETPKEIKRQIEQAIYKILVK